MLMNEPEFLTVTTTERESYNKIVSHKMNEPYDERAPTKKNESRRAAMPKYRMRMIDLMDCPRCDTVPELRHSKGVLLHLQCPKCGYLPKSGTLGVLHPVFLKGVRTKRVLRASQLWNDRIAKEYGKPTKTVDFDLHRDYSFPYHDITADGRWK